MSQKRKRDNDASALSAAQDHFRTWLIKNTSDAVEYIKKDFLSGKNLNTKEKSWLSFDQVWGYLSIPQDEQAHKTRFGKALSAHPRVESKDDKDGIVFQFKPVIPATNADDLLEYLARQQDSKQVTVADLQVGWPDCVPEVNRLERAHHILVRRVKGKARAVWLDSPDLHMQVDDDFRDLWSGIKVPEDIEEIRKDLKTTNMMVTSEKKEVPVVRPKKSKKGGRRAGKGIQTNKHMESVLKNFGKK
ncbi:unnamed protein product [Zymoseptoria tritici ST99CH_1A5]|uniref:TFA2 Winged helix domain-containing protein n=4 Tax=Zymoseptoria tritici TaxID=1047171 RepID=F9XDI8_ZYMTI|nr:uncharacterized protein MYCGRDRAFT_93943 [Zymoseptoria tritici IPO323]SMQ51785.1 unnamed protein product [Zymoseptoria tritici ST99CH_3D7]SMR54128.1 unnamed protein product [Zymoseptoria tritici ST99CH_1E4]SMR56246.1 unnamed protein product [Zymoseptoria tritici ST99CH_3D1]SMY25428.1 unnamed protein product [Zymoseptoria tritici ST99CH_1A5]EGP86795.1 hypothetical protein MYCGRDRAFT_93943 [Zymoseptoria tritici IPO323]